VAIEAISGDIHPENKARQMFCRKMGFQLAYSPADHFFMAKPGL
jgi:hypothetical protein